MTKQMESDLHDHYGWDPAWGTTYFGASDTAAPLLEPLIFSEAAARQAAAKESRRGEGDPHLQNVNVTRDQVKSSPPWDPAMADQVGEQQLHRHFGWRGYGW